MCGGDVVWNDAPTMVQHLLVRILSILRSDLFPSKEVESPLRSVLVPFNALDGNMSSHSAHECVIHIVPLID